METFALAVAEIFLVADHGDLTQADCDFLGLNITDEAERLRCSSIGANNCPSSASRGTFSLSYLIVLVLIVVLSLTTGALAARDSAAAANEIDARVNALIQSLWV